MEHFARASAVAVTLSVLISGCVGAPSTTPVSGVDAQSHGPDSRAPSANSRGIVTVRLSGLRVWPLSMVPTGRD